MRRKASFIFMCVLILLCMQGCSEKNKNAEQGTVTADGQKQEGTEKKIEGETGEHVTLTFWLDNTTTQREEAYQKLINKFEEIHPNIEIDMLGVPGDIKEKLDVSLAAGSPPDCSTIVQNGLASYILNGELINLDSYYNDWEKKDEIVESAMETIKTFNPLNDGIYAMPFAANVWVMWVRSNEFTDAGISLPVTWDDFFTAADALTDKPSGKYGLAIRGGAGGGTSLEYMMYAYSGIENYFDEEGHCTVNDPKNVEFVKRYLGLYGIDTAEGDINNGWTELAAAFQSDKAAMILHNLGSASSHSEIFDGDYSKFEAIRIPMGESGYTVHPKLNVSGYCIYSESKHPEEAWEFISYLCEAEQASYAANIVGIMPMNKKALEDEWIKELPYFSMAADMLNDPQTRFYDAPIIYPEYSSIMSTSIEPMIQKVMAGQMEAQEMCDIWAELMEEMKQEYDANFH